MSADTTQAPTGTRARVLDACQDLANLGRPITRETVAELTDLKLAVVDDRLGVLLDDGHLRRVLRGVYELVHIQPPSRPISKTVLPDGTVKVEIGDEVLQLTPKEERTLAAMFASPMAVYEASVRTELASANIHEIAAKMREMSAEIKRLRSKLSNPQQEPSLFS